jgi:hypothetical protein
VWMLLKVGAKARTTMSVDVVPSLETYFPTSPPTILDVVGENLPLACYLVGAFSVVSSLEALLGFPVPRLLLVSLGGAPSYTLWCRPADHRFL